MNQIITVAVILLTLSLSVLQADDQQPASQQEWHKMTQPNMRTILFLDDWPILTRQGLDRRWFQAEPWPGVTPWHDPLLDYSSVTAVRRDPKTGAGGCGAVVAPTVARATREPV